MGGNPGFGYYKINSAYHFGELYDLPGGGPELASRTVEEFLGVPIDYYAQVDFQAFVDFVDHINGIKVTFDEPYTIDPRGPGNTVTLEPGTYVLDGDMRWRWPVIGNPNWMTLIDPIGKWKSLC